MSSGKQVPPPTQWEIQTYHRIWDELAPFFDSRSRAKEVVFFMLYKEESYIHQVLENHRKEVQYLISRVAAAEAEQPRQIREEMDAAIYK